MDRWMGLVFVAVGILAIMTPVWIYTAALRAAHRRFAAAQSEATLTLVGVRDKDLVASLARAQQGRATPPHLNFTLVVTVSIEGVTFWSGTLTPRPITQIVADRVRGVDLGSYTERPEYRQPALPRIKFTVSDPRDAEATVDLQFGIVKPRTNPFIARYLREPDVQQVVGQARAALKGTPTRTAVAPAPSVVTMRPGVLEPGETAYTASRVGKVRSKYVITALWVVVAPFVLWAAFTQTFAPLLGAIVVQMAVVGVLLWRETRAVAREEAAGYTTLNGQHLHLEQRHPVTGMVIREAGGTALSNERFRELLHG